MTHSLWSSSDSYWQYDIADFENFWSKINTFLFNSPNDSPCFCHHFHTRPLVVGDHLRRRNPRKQQRNAINYICFVTSSMTSALWVVHHLNSVDMKFQDFGRLSAAITWWRSGMNKNLKKTLERHLVDQFWWQIPQKIGNLLLISNSYTLKLYVRLSYFLSFLETYDPIFW